MGQLLSGKDEAMVPFTELANKFRNYDTGVEKAPEEQPFLKKKKGEKINVKPESAKEEEKKDLKVEEEKTQSGPDEVTLLKSLNMEDVINKTRGVGNSNPWRE